MTKKKLTITDLLKEKEKYQVKEGVTEDLFISRMGASVTLEKPNRSLCIEALSMKDENGETDGDVFLVYNTIIEPNLKDSELQKEFGCVEPTDIVEKIFEPGEIVGISGRALELAGYGDSVSSVDDLKN